VRTQFGEIPGVDIIGLGAKERNGKSTDEWAFRFYVREKRPLHEIPEHERIPDQIFGVQTDVIPHFEKTALVCDASVLSIDEVGYRDSGIRGGISIRNEFFDNDQPSGYGTLGVLARRKTDNALVGLTCAHVVNTAGLVDAAGLPLEKPRIGQPKYWVSCCCCPHGYIGDVDKATATEDLDCAIIVIHDDIKDKVIANNTENKIEGITGDITGAAAMICFDNLQKRGRSTGLTTGKVTEIAYGTNQMLIERTDGNPGDPFACHGDSGAVIVNSGNQVVGLLVAADREGVAGVAAPLTRIIATHIKPVMIELGITIAGTDAADIGDPIGGGPTGCELLIWPGGQADTALNPVEIFQSSDFGFSGDVLWDVSKGGAGAVIVETGTQTATASSISVRYNAVSASKNATDTVWIQALKGSEPLVTKFRTVFSITPRAVNTASVLDSDNTKRFAATGGTNTQAGAAIPGTDGATWYLAKAEIVYDILPQGLNWSGGGPINFVSGAPANIKGTFVARRQTTFTKGQQATGAANRTHTDQIAFASAGDSTADDFQGPTNALPNKIFRLANEGFDPTNLLQGYLRADFQDYLEFNIDSTPAGWIRVTPVAPWFANLTADQSGTGTAPPVIGAPNNIGAGTNTEKIPNQKPTVTVEDFQEVRFGETVTLTATPADPDHDELHPAAWVKTDGPGVTLNNNPGNTATFVAPADDFQFKFSVTVKDKTEGLSRALGNAESDPVEIIVNVIEWSNKQGGKPQLCINNEEVFNAADFGIGGGPLNWDVTTGGTQAVIIEADGASIAPAGTVNGATTIKVNYNTVSADLTRANSVKIQATNPGSGKIWYKRRSVTIIPFAVTTAVAQVAPSASSITLLGPNTWGLTYPEEVIVTICAYRDGVNWRATLLKASGEYSLQARLLPGPPAVIEVTGPGGNTTEANYCDQMNNLDSLNGPIWYMLGAVTAHEQVHATRFLPALNDATVLPVLITDIESITVPHVAGMNQAAAIASITALPAFATARVNAFNNWFTQILVLVSAGGGDHGPIPGVIDRTAPTYIAEIAIVTPMITAICAHARANGWAACPPLCP